MTTKRVRWGILGCADIARTALIPALRETEAGVLHAVGSRNRERAEQFAAEHGIEHAYASYDAVLEDPAVDAVYIPLPNTLHAQWIERAAAHGKHVFCEKPLTMTYEEAKSAVEACRRAGVLLVEAFVYRFHRQTAHIRKLLDDGAIGEVLHTESRFHYAYRGDMDNIRMKAETGGGALLDIGCYVVSWSRFVMGGAPRAVAAFSVADDVAPVDKTTVATLLFPGGKTAHASSGIRMFGWQHAMIYGTDGSLEVGQPFHPGANLGADPDEAEIWLYQGGEKKRASVPITNRAFTDAINSFHRAILEGEALPFDTMSDALEQARTMDAVKQAATDGRIVQLIQD